MPCYNSVDYITDAVQSIMAQTFTDWELLIVDDCSTDKRIFPLLEKIVAMDARIKVLRTEVNAGAGVARNVAIKEAKGRYIAFCDSDDWWCPDKLERQMKWMKNNDYHFICSYYETCDECLNPFHVVRLPRKIGFKRLCCGYAVGPSGVVYDTKHIGKVFMPQLRRGEDMATWLRILRRTQYLYTFPEVVWKYRVSFNSASSYKLKMAADTITMYHRELSISKTLSFCLLAFVYVPHYFYRKAAYAASMLWHCCRRGKSKTFGK